MSALLAAGISAAGNLIGGLLEDEGPSLKKQYKLQNKFQQKATNYQFKEQSRYDERTRLNMFKQIKEGAQRAGINPLTALGVAPQNNSVGAPGISMPLSTEKPNPIGDAIRAGAETYAQTFEDPIEKETRAENLEYLKKRNAQIQGETDRQGMRSLSENSPTAAEGITSQFGTGTKEDPIQLYIWGIDPTTGTVGMIPNPALPDLEQLPVPQTLKTIWATDKEGNVVEMDIKKLWDKQMEVRRLDAERYLTPPTPSPHPLSPSPLKTPRPRRGDITNLVEH